MNRNQFRKLILGLLVIFALESTVYFSRQFLNPSPTFAQTQPEATSSALPASPLSSEVLTKEETPHTIPPKLPILIYHYVEYVTDERDTIRQSLNVNPHTFENQITTLKDAGYTFITPSQIQNLENPDQYIEKPVIITFDDGYKDFYTDVFPIIKKHNVKVVAYIVPGFLDKLNYMKWEDVKEISTSGLVEIGAHTMRHASLGRLTDEVAFEEINNSKIILEMSLGKKITAFAYPYGHFNNKTPNIVKSAGFTSALTTEEGPNDSIDNKFLFKRIHPGGRIGQDLLSAVN